MIITCIMNRQCNDLLLLTFVHVNGIDFQSTQKTNRQWILVG